MKLKLADSIHTNPAHQQGIVDAAIKEIRSIRTALKGKSAEITAIANLIDASIEAMDGRIDMTILDAELNKLRGVSIALRIIA